MAKKLKDPVDNIGELQEGKGLPAELELVSLDNVEMKPMPDEVARTERPFDGYPLKFANVPWQVKKDKVEMHRLCLSHLVAYNHIAYPIKQDPSNPTIRTKDFGMQKIRTHHNRSIRDVTGGPTDNLAIRFDIPVKTKAGDFLCAYVPNDYARAQICFLYNAKSQKPEVDKHYILLDPEQGNRLRRCFNQVISRQVAIEKAADYISAPVGQEGPAVEIPETV